MSKSNRRVLIESEVEYRASLAPVLKPLRNPPVPINPPSRPGTSDGKTTPFMRNPSYVDHLLEDEASKKEQPKSRPGTSSSTLNNIQISTSDLNQSSSPSYSSSPLPSTNHKDSPIFNSSSSFNPLVETNLPPIKTNLPPSNTKLHPGLAPNSTSPSQSSPVSPKEIKHSRDVSPPSNSKSPTQLPPALKLNTNSPLFNLNMMDMTPPTTQRIRVKEKELKNNLLNSLIKNKVKIDKLSLPPTFQTSRSIKMSKYLKNSMESMAAIQEQFIEAESKSESHGNNEGFSPTNQEENIEFNKNHPLFNRSASALNFRIMLERQNSRINYNTEKTKENELKSTQSFVNAINGVKKDIKNFKKREMVPKHKKKKTINRRSSSASSPSIGLNSDLPDSSRKSLVSQSHPDLNKVMVIDKNELNLDVKNAESKSKSDKSKDKEKQNPSQNWDSRFIHLNLLSKPYNKNATALYEPKKHKPVIDLNNFLLEESDEDNQTTSSELMIEFSSKPIPPPHIKVFPYCSKDEEEREQNYSNNNSLKSSLLSKSLKKHCGSGNNTPVATSHHPPSITSSSTFNHNFFNENNDWNSESEISARYLLTNWPGGISNLKNYFNCLNSIYLESASTNPSILIKNPFNLQNSNKEKKLDETLILKTQLKEWLSSRIVTPAVHISLNYIAILLNIEETLNEEKKKFENVDLISKKIESRSSKEINNDAENFKTKKKILKRLSTTKNKTNYSWMEIKNFLINYKIENVINFILNLTPFDIPIHLLYIANLFLIKKRNFIIKKKKNFLVKHFYKNSVSSSSSVVSSSSSISSISTLNLTGRYDSFDRYLNNYFCNCHLYRHDEINFRNETNASDKPTSINSEPSVSPPSACNGACIMKPLGDPLLLYTLKNNEGEFETDKDKDINQEKFNNSFKDSDLNHIFISSKNIPFINYRYVSTKLLVWVILFNTIGSVRFSLEKKRLLDLYDEEMKNYYQNMNFIESENELEGDYTEFERDDALHYYNETEEHIEENEIENEDLSSSNISLNARVKVNYNNKGKYYEGTISNMLDRNTYSVQYDDGEYQEKVSIDLIELLTQENVVDDSIKIIEGVSNKSFEKEICKTKTEDNISSSNLDTQFIQDSSKVENRHDSVKLNESDSKTNLQISNHDVKFNSVEKDTTYSGSQNRVLGSSEIDQKDNLILKSNRETELSTQNHIEFNKISQTNEVDVNYDDKLEINIIPENSKVNSEENTNKNVQQAVDVINPEIIKVKSEEENYEDEFEVTSTIEATEVITAEIVKINSEEITNTNENVQQAVDVINPEIIKVKSEEENYEDEFEIDTTTSNPLSTEASVVKNESMAKEEEFYEDEFES